MKMIWSAFHFWPCKHRMFPGSAKTAAAVRFFFPCLVNPLVFCQNLGRSSWKLGKNAYLQKLTWWGWGFRFCRHISGQHQNGLYKTKNIAFEQEKIRPTKSKHPTPLLLGHKAKEVPTKSKSLDFSKNRF